MRGSLFLQTKRLLPRCSRHKRKNRPENQAGLLRGGNFVLVGFTSQRRILRDDSRPKPARCWQDRLAFHCRSLRFESDLR